MTTSTEDDAIWQEQLVALSTFSDDNYNDGTVAFARIRGIDTHLCCSRLLLPPGPPLSTKKTGLIKERPLFFHVIGRLRREACSVATSYSHESGDEVVSIKLCLQALPEYVSSVEWAQCTTTMEALEMMAITQTSKYVQSKDVFCVDSKSGELHLYVEGCQVHQASGAIRSTTAAAADSRCISDSTGIRVGSNSASVPFSPSSEMRKFGELPGESTSTVHQVVVNPVAFGSAHQGIIPQPSPSGGFFIYGPMDHRIVVTSVSQLPEYSPVRVTFSLELHNDSESEHLVHLRSKLAKVTVLAPTV